MKARFRVLIKHLMDKQTATYDVTQFHNTVLPINLKRAKSKLNICCIIVFYILQYTTTGSNSGPQNDKGFF